MGVDLSAETIDFLGTITAGFICGILYDLLHTIGILSNKKPAISFFDILFILSACFVTFCPA